MLVTGVDRADQLLGRVEKSLKELNGTGIKVDRLGKKALAYPIKKHGDAVYFLVDFEISAEAIKPISDKLRLEQEDLLRYLLLKKEKVLGKKGKRARSQEARDAQEKEQAPAKKPQVTVVTKTKFLAKVKEKKATKVSKVRPSFAKASEGKKVSKAKKETKGTKAKKGEKSKH